MDVGHLSTRRTAADHPGCTKPIPNTTRPRRLHAPPAENRSYSTDPRNGLSQIAVSEPMDSEVTTSGVVNAMLRFHGVLLASRADVAQCTSRIFEKVTQLLLKDTSTEK